MMNFSHFRRSKGGPSESGVVHDNSAEVGHHLQHSQWLQEACGVPATSDSIAYDPIQKVFAVATSDGKIKLFGRAGVEATLYSASAFPYSSKQLLWFRGILARVSKGGFVEAWSFTGVKPNASAARTLNPIRVKRDKITCVCAMPTDPYLLLGCASGSLRIASMIALSGSPTTRPASVTGFTLAPYRVAPLELQGTGEVKRLEIHPQHNTSQALVLFSAGCVTLWDLRARVRLGSIQPDMFETGSAVQQAGMVTACCWLGSRKNEFATGHEEGSVFLWSLPVQARPQTRSFVQGPVLRVSVGDAAPVRQLLSVWLPPPACGPSLLVTGGQPYGEPEGLMLLPLPQPQPRSPSSTDILSGSNAPAAPAAMGYGETDADEPPAPAPCILSCEGSLVGCALAHSTTITPSCCDEATEVVMLLGGGRLLVYDLKLKAAQEMRTAFQAAPAITCVVAVMLPKDRLDGCPAYSLSISSLQRAHVHAGHSDDASMGLDACSTGTLAGGTPAQAPKDAACGLVYCTGHHDGSTRLWDMSAGMPRLLATAPSCRNASLGKALQPVTALQLHWPEGLVVVGHAKGDVRMYQFSGAREEVLSIELRSAGSEGNQHSLLQQSGLQLRLLVNVCSHDITSLAYSAAAHAVVAGDACGGVLAIDVSTPAVMWYLMPSQQPTRSVCIAPAALPPSRMRSGELAGLGEGAVEHLVLAANGEGAVACIALMAGMPVCKGGELRPKNHFRPLLLEPLDAAGCPTWMQGMVWSQSSLLCGGSKQSTVLQYSTQEVRGGSAARHAGSGGRQSPSIFDQGSEAQVPNRHSQGATGNPQAGIHAGNKEEDEESDDEQGVDELLAAAAKMIDKQKAAERRDKVLGVVTLGLSKVAREIDREKGSEEAKASGGSSKDATRSVSPPADVNAASAVNKEEEDNPFALAAANIRRIAKPSKPARVSTSAREVLSTQQDAFSEGRRSASPPAATPPDTSGNISTAAAVSRTPGLASGAERMSQAGAAAALPHDADPEALYVLLASDLYLRVYSMRNALTGERETYAKRELSQPLLTAHTMAAAGLPALVGLARGEAGLRMQVFSLPNLELVSDVPMSQACSWYWDVSPGSSMETHLNALVGVSQVGHMLLLGAAQELLVLALAAGVPPPPAPSQLYCEELAEAAASALAVQASLADAGAHGGGGFGAAAMASAVRIAAALSSRVRTPQPTAQLPASSQFPDATGKSTAAAASMPSSNPTSTGGAADTAFAPGGEANSGASQSDNSATLAELQGLDIDMVRTEGRRVESGPRQAVVKGNALLGSMFSKVHAGLNKAVESASKGLATVTTAAAAAAVTASAPSNQRPTNEAGGTSTHAIAGSHDDDAAFFATENDLAVVFSMHVPEDKARRKGRMGGHAGMGHGSPYGHDDDDGVPASDISILRFSDDDDASDDHADDDDDDTIRPTIISAPCKQALPSRRASGMGASIGAALKHPPGHAGMGMGATGGGAKHTPSNTADDGNRRSLFAGAATSSRSPKVPCQRTASEVKRAYRPQQHGQNGDSSDAATSAASRAAHGVRDVMDANRAALEQRGEKLRQLDRKAADLEENAMGFAAMARQIAERERNKKWWQL